MYICKVKTNCFRYKLCSILINMCKLKYQGLIFSLDYGRKNMKNPQTLLTCAAPGAPGGAVRVTLSGRDRAAVGRLLSAASPALQLRRAAAKRSGAI